MRKDLWEDKGYGYLGLKSQNLRDQASRLKKKNAVGSYEEQRELQFNGRKGGRT